MGDNVGGKPHVAAIAEGSHKFGFSLLARVVNPEKNAVFSGYSVSSVLSLASLGAKENTLKQIQDALCLPGEVETLKSAYYDITSATKSDGDVTLETANSIFPSVSLETNPEFIKDAEKYFDSQVVALDYSKDEEVRETLNQWVDKCTNGAIGELFEPGSIQSDTKALLVNSIYFKGRWLTQFDPANTTEKDFHVSPEKVVKVPTMTSPKMRFAASFNEDLNCTIASLPYQGGRVIMYLLIPKEPFGLPDLETKLCSEDFNPSLLDKVNNSVQSLIQLPKFKVESLHDLGEACGSLGLSDLFGEQCNLSGIAGAPGELYVSKALQKAVIEVGEEGSEAASSTGLMIMVRSVFFSDPLIVDHPFAFMIKDKNTGLVLFTGRVVDPSM